MEETTKLPTQDETMPFHPKEVDKIREKDHKKRLTPGKIIVWGLLLVIISAIIYIVVAVNNSLGSSVSIVNKNFSTNCNFDNCISFNAYYKNGAASWEANPSWLMNLDIVIAGFQENTNVSIVCPVELKSNFNNHIITKIAFFFDKSKARECKVYVRN